MYDEGEEKNFGMSGGREGGVYDEGEEKNFGMSGGREDGVYDEGEEKYVGVSGCRRVGCTTREKKIMLGCLGVGGCCVRRGRGKEFWDVRG